MSFDIARYWYRPSSHWLTVFLWPLACLYGGVTKIRRLLYRLGLFKVHHFPVPVIVVGNLTVGGTGKTPFVIWLAHFLRSQGYQPGIVSRGVGGIKHQTGQRVTEKSAVTKVGDEALLLTKKTMCPVVVSVNRPRAVETLLRHSACDVVISDDGLQHYALARDIEIVMIDGARGFGNGHLLPMGPLREPITRLREVDFTLINGPPVKADIKNAAIMSLVPDDDLLSVSLPQQKKPLTAFSHTTVHAVAGIGHPERFFLALQKAGLKIVRHIFPDHYLYEADDFNFQDALPIIMTEKDAVKCVHFADERYWSWPVSVLVSDVFAQGLLGKLS